jgi:hypothetical protein
LICRDTQCEKGESKDKEYAGRSFLFHGEIILLVVGFLKFLLILQGM